MRVVPQRTKLTAMDELELTAEKAEHQKITLSFDEERSGLLRAVLAGFDHLDEAEELLQTFLGALAELSERSPYAVAQLFQQANENRPDISTRMMIADAVIANPLPGNKEPVSVTVNIQPREDGQARHQLFSNLPGQVTKKLLNAMHDKLMEKVA